MTSEDIFRRILEALGEAVIAYTQAGSSRNGITLGRRQTWGSSGAVLSRGPRSEAAGVW
jgi:hypothetical protein